MNILIFYMHLCFFLPFFIQCGRKRNKLYEISVDAKGKLKKQKFGNI